MEKDSAVIWPRKQTEGNSTHALIRASRHTRPAREPARPCNDHFGGSETNVMRDIQRDGKPCRSRAELASPLISARACAIFCVSRCL